MCAIFTVRYSTKTIKNIYGVKLDASLKDIPDDTVAPFKLAPAIHMKNGELVAEAMQFSLLPRWSKERKPKFATYNARLDSVDEKASFKDAFTKRHCVVPISAFVEPIYTGKLAGNMVAFESESEPILSAAGIWEEWTSKTSGEIVHSFALLTHDPMPFVEKTGHDRSPLFLTSAGTQEWLASEGQKPDHLKKLLLDHRLVPPLSAAIHRPMKEGWQKRAH
ncbi:MAG: SOS response-associated peptidase family protein [Bdellovibrionales bacterium]|nr:SOS response-associated peptidase family protein [Bdellovibrionales bacterium]